MENLIDKPQLSHETATQKLRNEMSHIIGWGVDANRENDPTYPMRDRGKENTKNYDWERPPLQPTDVEILCSNERPSPSAVFGTSATPSGLSGMIRRFAFRYSEGQLLHWLSLILADRVNVVEGVVTDVATGHVPNILAERGMKAEWKHNPGAVVTKAVVGAALITSIALIIKRRRK